ncbi:hypothetical protein BWQ96_06137 [Gracilariopsis chorda]|uniref:Uncharacterized protein n=1 Tax=Gracilariopsis chorda TaxID=448386 RepID=A0A2V3IPP6_9FLOR|nr:hypothetical protein BWQ96_06137 [Gracilariopsis chorda]|eukprot:PXF44056.1 hypothetical protein BWQ96_06137 [Gracilariopsis chorda]
MTNMIAAVAARIFAVYVRADLNLSDVFQILEWLSIVPYLISTYFDVFELPDC